MITQAPSCLQKVAYRTAVHPTAVSVPSGPAPAVVGDRRVGAVESVADGPRELFRGWPGPGSTVAKWDESAQAHGPQEGYTVRFMHSRVAARRERARAPAANSGAAKPGSRCDGSRGRRRGRPDATGTAASAGGGRYLRTPARQGRDASPRGRAAVLLRVMPRKLHAAWAELCGTKARMPPTVADELAPTGAGPRRSA